MDIKFENKFSSKTALLLVCFSGKQILNTNILSEATRKLVKDFTSKNKNKHNIIQTINLSENKNINHIILAKPDDTKKINSFQYEEFGGKVFTHIEKQGIQEISVLIDGVEKSLKLNIESIIN